MHYCSEHCSSGILCVAVEMGLQVEELIDAYEIAELNEEDVEEE